VIRIVTLARMYPADLVFLTRTLYRAFGVGTEHAADKPVPKDARTDDDRLDAVKLLKEGDPIRTFPDDKVLFVTDAPLALRPGPLGEPPCWGFAELGGTKAVITTSIAWPTRS